MSKNIELMINKNCAIASKSYFFELFISLEKLTQLYSNLLKCTQLKLYTKGVSNKYNPSKLE